MNIAPAVFELLRNDDTISGFVSDRIYPDEIPQEKPYPAIVHYKTEVEEPPHKGGPTTNYRVTLQIDTYTDAFGDGEKIATAIKSLLHEYKGIVQGINIQSCFFRTQSDEKFISELETNVTSQSFLFKVVVSN